MFTTAPNVNEQEMPLWCQREAASLGSLFSFLYWLGLKHSQSHDSMLTTVLGIGNTGASTFTASWKKTTGSHTV